MAELLLELLTEEIPARMQGVAAEELRRLARDRFRRSRPRFHETRQLRDAAAADAHCRRPAAWNSPARSKSGAVRASARREPAIHGFLKSTGLASIEECEKRDDRQGRILFRDARKRPGQTTKDMLPGPLGRGDPQSAVAQIDALAGGAVPLGAAAAKRRLPARRPHAEARSRRRAGRRRTTRGHRFLTQGQLHTSPTSPTIAASCAMSMSCSMPASAAR